MAMDPTGELAAGEIAVDEGTTAKKPALFDVVST